MTHARRSEMKKAILKVLTISMVLVLFAGCKTATKPDEEYDPPPESILETDDHTMK
jgi:hypothetical protein